MKTTLKLKINMKREYPELYILRTAPAVGLFHFDAALASDPTPNRWHRFKI
jgi:hypothetical protein